MRVALICMLLFAGVTASTMPAHAASSAFDAAFERARAIRTSDPSRLSAALAELDGMVADATPLQRGRLQILHAYRMAIGGDGAGSVALLKSLVSTDNPDAVRFEAGGLLANTFAMTREFEGALQTLENVLPLEPSIEDRDVRHTVLQSASIVYNQVGEYRTGIRYAERMLADRPSGRGRCIASNVILEGRLGLGLSIDRKRAFEGLEGCEAERDAILSGFMRTHIARWLYTSGNTGEAIKLLEGALAGVERAGYPLLIGMFHASLAEYRLASGDRARASANARYAVETLSALQSAQPLVTAHRALYEIAQTEGDAEAALAAYRRYAEAESAYTSDVKSREMAYQVVRHQSLQQAQQIELLHQKNQLLELQQSVTEQRARSWLLLALVLVGLVASIGYWAYKTKRMQLRLKRMTETDALTGIFNRQYFAERATAALLQCEREGLPATLVMFDLDHFKQVNDRHGHAAGDWALRQIAEAVQPLCRGMDAFGRLGGEEFAMLLPGLDASAAVRLAGDAQARFAGIDTTAAGYGFRLAASFGVAETRQGGYALATLLSHADQAMYAAKRGGRCQARVYASGIDDANTGGETIELLRETVREPVTGAEVPPRRAIA